VKKDFNKRRGCETVYKKRTPFNTKNGKRIDAPPQKKRNAHRLVQKGGAPDGHERGGRGGKQDHIGAVGLLNGEWSIRV